MTQSYSSSTLFTFAYHGEELDDNSMDARDLVEVVQGTHRLITTTNSLVNGNLVMPDLRVKTPRPGSFEIDFGLGLMQSLAFVGASNFVVSALNIQRLLFGGASIGLVGLLKQLKGRRASEITPLADESGAVNQVKIRADYLNIPGVVEAEGLELDIPVDLNKLLSDHAITSSLSQIVSPLRKDRIERLDIFQGQTATEQVAKEDLISFGVDHSKDSVETVKEYGKELIVETLTFTEARMWRLRQPEKEAKPESYFIRDENYKLAVRGGEQMFAAGTVLICDTKTTSYVSRDGKSKVNREVLKVHTHRPGNLPDPRQGQFPFY